MHGGNVFLSSSTLLRPSLVSWESVSPRKRPRMALTGGFSAPVPALPVAAVPSP